MVPLIGFAQADPKGDTVQFQRTQYQIQADGNLNQLQGDGNVFAYRQTLWLSGMSYDSDTVMHLSAQEYRLSRIDYYPGPISSDSIASAYSDRTWTVTKGMVDSIGADIDQIKVVHQSIGVAEMEEVALEFLLGQDDDHFYIDNPYNESFEFEILDLNGRPLITSRMAASAKTQIRTTELPPGVYILRTTDAMFATKWIKQP